MRLVSRTCFLLLGISTLLLGFHEATMPNVDAATTAYDWYGTTDSIWGTSSNWGAAGVAPTDGTYDVRLNVRGGTLVYGTDQGHTIYAGSTSRALFVYAGEAQITGGTLDARSNSVSGDGLYGASSRLTINGGNYINTSSNIKKFSLIGTDSTLNIQSGTFTTGTLTFGESGVGSNGNVYVNLDGGTLTTGGIVNNRQAFELIGTFNFNGGILKASQSNAAFMQDIGSTTTPGHAYVKAGGALVDTNGFDIAIGQPLETGVTEGTDGGLTKIGNGMLTLPVDAVSTYTGATIVSAGTLLVDGSLANTSSVAVSGGTLGGSGSIDGAVTVDALSTLAPGADGGVGILTLGNTLSLADGASMKFDLDTVSDSDMVSMTSSALSLNGQEFSDFTFMALSGFGIGDYTLIDAGSVTGSLGANVSGSIGGYTSTLHISGSDLMLNVAIPEPGTLVLTILGLLGLIAYAWRKRK